MKILSLLALCAAALLSTPVFAEEADPLRGKIQELEARARTAKEQGRADESHELMQQVRRLHAEMGERERQRGGGEELAMAKRKIDELHKAGKHEEAEQLEHRLREAGEQQGDRERKDGAGEAERRQHAMEAIKHLHAAGLHEPAERIEQMLHEQGGKSEQVKRERGEKAGRSGSEDTSPREGQEQMQRALREVQEQTQRAMREVQEQSQRALRDTHEQMAKMARAIDEVREQAGKQRGDGGHRKD